MISFKVLTFFNEQRFEVGETHFVTFCRAPINIMQHVSKNAMPLQLKCNRITRVTAGKLKFKKKGLFSYSSIKYSYSPPFLKSFKL